MVYFYTQTHSLIGFGLLYVRSTQTNNLIKRVNALSHNHTGETQNYTAADERSAAFLGHQGHGLGVFFLGILGC